MKCCLPAAQKMFLALISGRMDCNDWKIVVVLLVTLNKWKGQSMVLITQAWRMSKVFFKNALSNGKFFMLIVGKDAAFGWSSVVADPSKLFKKIAIIVQTNDLKMCRHGKCLSAKLASNHISSNSGQV